MKQYVMVFGFLFMVFFFHGCNDRPYEGQDNLTTLFLVDDKGYTYANIPYRCTSMTQGSRTASNGEFSFRPPDTCTFDFTGLAGDYFGDPYIDDIVHIVDSAYQGKGGIPYECVSFGAGKTFHDGSFEYDIDDHCVFYF